MRNSSMVVTRTGRADEDYWSIIQQAFTVNPNIINLNNGGVIYRQKWCRAVERYNKND